MSNKKFTIVELREHLENKFPDSFSFGLFPIKKGNLFGADYDAVKSYKGLTDAEVGAKIFFPQYNRTPLNFTFHQGGENSYFDFLLEGENQEYYVGTFGFKDGGDVPKEYITRFIAFLMDAYGLPFQVTHSVMEKGGVVGSLNYSIGGL